ncbi:MAG: amino acid ABC transporter ATP-binding protein [Planctomycetes bacterium]|nr:amino acid ABC transporter ATP-binding protein [Planctomycetota bacterium]
MILRAEKLCKKFEDRVVLSDVSLEIDRGTVLALCGPSGAGKTTLIRILGGLIGFDAGCITLGDRSITEHDAYPPELYGQIGLVFQDHNLFPHMTAMENVELALRRVRRLGRREARDRAMAELEGMGLADLADRYPYSLSGGERQRVAIARALAMDPLLLLLDEITSFLDPSMVGEVLSCILRLAQRGTTMLLVTHNLAFARQAAGRFGVLEGGRLTVSDQPELLDRLAPEWS